ncbi:MAG TPA: PorP/SprF family type IX secretion system membrane protein [Flavipsychrobacter sp.]|nr:PorP/SprF family type IX secretion system membrane protein [Flavipsychrobacter sp.]
MKKNTLYIKLIFALLIIANVKAVAQDIHFSQFYETTILNNPALTGVFDGDYKAGAIYRNQWGSVGVPFQTTLINLESKVRVNTANDYLSFGLLGYFDKAGTINFSTLGLYPAINYNKSMEDKYGSYLDVGFTGGYIQRSIDVSKMTFDNQYQGGIILPISTSENIPNPKMNYFDLGAGVIFNSSLDEENQINYFIGAAAYHFTSPKASFYSGTKDANLSIRWDGNAGLNYNFDETYALQFYINAMFQSPYQEIVGGAMLKWSAVNGNNSQPFSLYLGAFYRFQDAWIPALKIQYRRNSFGISYDVNNSTLKNVTGMHGGFEISLINTGMFVAGYDDKHQCPRF